MIIELVKGADRVCYIARWNGFYCHGDSRMEVITKVLNFIAKQNNG